MTVVLRWVTCSVLVLFHVLAGGPAAFTANGSDAAGERGYRCGTSDWGVLNSLGREALRKLQLQRQGHFQTLARQQTASADVGDIAVLDDDGTLLVQANAFDLANRSLRFTPTGTGYQIAAGDAALDTAAAAAGTVLTLADDDTQEIPLGFSFTFYGNTYTSVFVNSDGNLTFTGGDVATTPRDLSRFLTGVPRIAPFFDDLNPAEGGQVTYGAEAGRFVMSWTDVPECCLPAITPKSTFQVALFPDGRVEFAYGTVSANDAVVGSSPGAFTGAAEIVDLSATDGTETIELPIAEVFSSRTLLSEVAVANRFYTTHEDAYDFLVMWTNFPVNLGQNVFAFALSIVNSTSGIGRPTFDFAEALGSEGRLSTLVMMGDLDKYPADPTQVIQSVPPNDTLSVLGQEAGHRWLVHFRYPFLTDPSSTILLGRDLAHWSFFFNSEASVVEGNEIRDNGDGTFTTTDAVRRYGSFDQYAMGLLAAGEVPPSFVVPDPDRPAFGHRPEIGVTFSGTRLDVTVEKLIEANGSRLPTAVVDQKNFSFAFILINARGSTATSGQIAKLETLQQQWEQFWAEATGGRSQANTRLVRALSFGGLPAAVAPGAQATVSLRTGSPADELRTFTLASSAPGVASVPSAVTLPAGTREVEFQVIAGASGVARITATAPGFETAEGALSVAEPAAVELTAISGGGQMGPPGATLAEPMVVEAREPNALPVAGAEVRFSATGGAIVAPAEVTTDAGGRVQTSVTLGSSVGTLTITASLVGLDEVRAAFTATALTQPQVPEGSAVNGASFAHAPAPVSPGSIISIFGTSLAPETQQATSLPLPTMLGNVTVRINEIAAPLFFVSPGQVNAQVPFAISGTSATVTVDNGTLPSASITLGIAPAVPGIFTLSQDGTGPGAVLHPDGSLITVTSPATVNGVVAIFCTGLGSVTPAVESGQPAPLFPAATTLPPPQVTIGGELAEVVFSGLAPGFAGLYQVNARVPAGLEAGAQPLVITSGLSSSSVTLAVE